ncbi:MAG: hypothetical protein ACI8QY_000158 [bacterium]|jgi:hypothetical protein
MKKTYIFVLALLLTACGYSPIYQHTKDAVQQVQVGTIVMTSITRSAGERRIAQLADKRLSQVFIAGDNALYTLSAEIEESTNTLAVLRDATEDRLEVVLNTDIFLKNKAGKEVFLRNLSATAPYNVETSPYGTEAGKDRARKSATIYLTEEIIKQVNYYLYNQK